MGHTGAYGVLTVSAFATDTMAVRRAATENDFIAVLRDDEWEGTKTLEKFPGGGVIYITSANHRTNNIRDPGHPIA
jgi:hypothetical protein